MTRCRLVADDAGELARAYGPGRPTAPMQAAARGELGRVWRLPSAAGPSR